MSQILDNSGHAKPAPGDVKCRTEAIGGPDCGDPGGDRINLQSPGGKHGIPRTSDVEHLERKKKTRRRKPKRKNPYNKQTSEQRTHKPTGKRIYARKQPEAPYNSNRFLIEDHNDLQDFDVKLMAVSANRPPRVRDSSFTSADSDEDFFYSSPEDEEEFLTKEFSNTYQDLHVESLTQMSKSELIQQVLQLEEKVDALEKRLESRIKPVERLKESDSGGGECGEEISTLELANEELQNENQKLRQQKKRSSSSMSSSVDSESDSSSSSSEMSDSSNSETKHSPPMHKITNGVECVIDNDCSMDTDSAR
ncbi:hypothetical protein AAG570_003135 [Ranatra chinensis]|uniref:Uncharacterized protein n=1 Tax=Ranatra chinensis TaxID=642074 RepID=A0ABD0Y825_9HEMI